MKSIKVCEYSRSRSLHYDLILQDQASGERSQDQWSSGFFKLSEILMGKVHIPRNDMLYHAIHQMNRLHQVTVFLF